jgi:hypothetical protein
LDEHKRFAVSAEGVLQKEGQFAVSEGNVLLLGNQSRNNVAKSAQALVDILRLFQTITGGA